MLNNDRRLFPLVSLAALLAFCAGCAGNPSTLTVPNAMAPGSFSAGASAFAQPAAAPAAPADRAAAEAVGTAIPALRDVPPGVQLRTLRWMLSVEDDRRLVSLFPDLQEDMERTLDNRGDTARQRLEELAAGLERAGHRAPAPEADVARIDENAPAPNYFPPGMIEELARHPNDPEAARALAEARRVSPRGVRPPGSR
ncbi:MAG TPA: hypothetical protein VJ725_33880 [Thermoanaerobaculia bacterium]|nr:hypothetical protein [Thermoanaerobaculia bacterium]